MSIKNAVYKFDYRHGEKVFSVFVLLLSHTHTHTHTHTHRLIGQCYIGKANVLHEEMTEHFDKFGKKRTEIREIDDELCHHTDMAGWEITVWPLEV